MQQRSDSSRSVIPGHLFCELSGCLLPRWTNTIGRSGQILTTSHSAHLQPMSIFDSLSDRLRSLPVNVSAIPTNLKTTLGRGKVRAQRGIGLDIGNDTIKLAVLANHKGQVRIERLISVPTPPSVLASGIIFDHDGLVAEIAGLLQRTGEKRNRVALALGGNDVFVLRVSIPRMSYAEALRQIPQNANLRLGIDPDVHKVDIHIVDSDAQGASMLVLVVAARKDAIENRQRVVMDAGAQIAAVDVGAFAVFNAFEHCNPDAARTRCTLLDLGHESSQIIVLDRGAPAIARSIDLGVAHLMDYLGESNLLPDEVPHVLRSSNPAAIYEDAFRVWGEALAEQVRRSVASITKNDPRSGTIYLTGGGAGIDGIGPFLSDVFKTQVSVFNPLQTMDSLDSSFMSSRQHGNSFTLAIGLALRQVVG